MSGSVHSIDLINIWQISVNHSEKPNPTGHGWQQWMLCCDITKWQRSWWLVLRLNFWRLCISSITVHFDISTVLVFTLELLHNNKTPGNFTLYNMRPLRFLTGKESQTPMRYMTNMVIGIFWNNFYFWPYCYDVVFFLTVVLNKTGKYWKRIYFLQVCTNASYFFLSAAEFDSVPNNPRCWTVER